MYKYFYCFIIALGFNSVYANNHEQSESLKCNPMPTPSRDPHDLEYFEYCHEMSVEEYYHKHRRYETIVEQKKEPKKKLKKPKLRKKDPTCNPMPLPSNDPHDFEHFQYCYGVTIAEWYDWLEYKRNKKH